MLMESSRALAECSPLAIHGEGPLLPGLEEIQKVSRKIAFAVAKKAVEQHKAPKNSDERIREKIDANFWQSDYRRYKRTSF
jgi:malate dehydrogenase (oxaloacetate-decarboxylating)